MCVSANTSHQLQNLPPNPERNARFCGTLFFRATPQHSADSRKTPREWYGARKGHGLCHLPRFAHDNNILPASITPLKATAGNIMGNSIGSKPRESNRGRTQADRRALFRFARSRRLNGARFNRQKKFFRLRVGDKLAAEGS
jgi:hypothetical protein